MTELWRSEVQFLMGTQKFFFVSRSWQDEKHLSLFFYRDQNLPSLLFHLPYIKLLVIRTNKRAARSHIYTCNVCLIVQRIFKSHFINLVWSISITRKAIIGRWQLEICVYTELFSPTQTMAASHVSIKRSWSSWSKKIFQHGSKQR